MPEGKLFECPACGSPLTTDGQEPEIVCNYCGRTVIVPEDLRVHPEPATPPPVQPVQPIVVQFPVRAPEPDTPRPRRRSGGCGCSSIMLLAIALVIAGVVASGSPAKAISALQTAIGGQGKGVSLGTLQAAIGFDTPVPTVVPLNRPLTAALPRAAQYAGLQFAVTGATITNQAPDTASNHERNLPRNEAHAYLNLKVNNPTASGIQADLNLLALRLAGGQSYPEESGWAEYINAQSTTEARIYFNVPSTAMWQGAALVIGTAGKEPAIIPLDGPAPAARYPLALKDRGKATVQDVDYEIRSAAVDLDAAGKRAATGHRFLQFGLRIFNHNSAPGGLAITTSNFRLVAGNDLLAPVEAPIELVHPSSVLQAEVVFDVPDNLRQAELQVGEVGKDTRRLPINIPAP